jgi:hypothetical protein
MLQLEMSMFCDSIAHFFVAVVMLCASRFDEELLVGGNQWVADYNKLGGVASFDDGFIKIVKRSNNKVLVDVDKVQSQPTARKVHLQGYEVSDDDLITVAKWKNVEVLHIVDGKKVTDKGVSALASLPNLREIVFGETSLTDKGIASFSGNKTLISMHITNNAKGNKLVDLKLTNMPMLKTLLLDCNGLKGVYLSSMPKLVSLPSVPLTVATVELKDIPSIDELNFANTQLSSLSLSKVPKLESLNVRKTMLNNESIDKIKANYPNVSIRR